MATKAEIRDRAANDLGLLRLGQSLQSQDKTRIESAYDEIYEDLVDRGLAVWPNTTAGEVPTGLVPHVVALVADNCLNTYSVPDSRYQRIKIAVNGDGASNKGAVNEISRLTTPEYESVEPRRDF